MTGRTLCSRIFEALSNPYRRQVLVALLDSNPQTDDDIDPMNRLGSRDPDDPPVTNELLVHVHLPKLANMGFIDWDRQSGEISRGPDWETIAPVVGLFDDHRETLPDGWVEESLSEPPEGDR